MDILKKCLNCNQNFIPIRKGNGKKYSKGMAVKIKFCSRKCWRKYIHNCILYRLCEECRKKFRYWKAREKTARFCSRNCLGKWISKTFNGEKHHAWKGGITKRGIKFKIWRKKVVERDQKCIKCGMKQKLVGHHIEHWDKDKDKRYDVKNGITLCVDCHAIEHPELSQNFIKKKITRQIKTCKQCGKKFLGRIINIFCSKKCRGLSSRKRIRLICENCNKNFKVKLYLKNIQKFCSQNCYQNYRINFCNK